MRMAVLGLGFMGCAHLRALGELPGVELAAVFSADERKLAGDLSGVRGNLETGGGAVDLSRVRKYREIEAALADATIEAVDICLPTWLHDSVAVEALRAGKHVLVEKPMALDGYGTDRMLAAARRSKRVLMTAQVLRFSPPYVALRKLLLQGQYGRPRVANFRRRCAAPDWSEWFGDPGQSGGGAFDLLIHDADMALLLFGKPKAVSAAGCVDRERGIDTLEAQLFYEDGALVSIDGGWRQRGAYPFSAEYSVVLDSAAVEYNSAGCPPALFAGGSAQPLELTGGDGYRAEIEYFVECCRTGHAPDYCPPAESADAVKFMLLMLEARRRNGVKLACRI